MRKYYKCVTLNQFLTFLWSIGMQFYYLLIGHVHISHHIDISNPLLSSGFLCCKNLGRLTFMPFPDYCWSNGYRRL